MADQMQGIIKTGVECKGKTRYEPKSNQDYTRQQLETNIYQWIAIRTCWEIPLFGKIDKFSQNQWLSRNTRNGTIDY